MYYSYVEIEYVATSFSPARTDLALKLLKNYLPPQKEVGIQQERQKYWGLFRRRPARRDGGGLTGPPAKPTAA
jgi:hypothetical protein